MGCFGPPDLGDFRIVYAHCNPPSGQPGVSVAEVHKHFANNIVVTSKYKLWNFLPKNLFEQFRRVANFYFLCVVIIQFCILSRTPISPATSLIPLVFVIAVTAVKQGYEDYLRHKADKEVNNRPAIVVRDGQEKEVFSKNIAVGDIVKVENHDEIPCDLVVVSTSELEGECHIMTANLDGETNLKVRESLQQTASFTSLDQLSNFQARVECDHPEYDMYKYNGRMILFNNGAESTHALGPSNLLLRGAKLKNTDYIYGLAVYTGKETKMALNQKAKTNKFSSVEKKMNSFLLLFLIILFFFSILQTILKYYWDVDAGKSWYIEMYKPKSWDAEEIIVTLLSFLILFNYIIPISLYVTVEVQKFCGSMFFNWDLELYHESTDEPAKANTSDLNEELGQIEYVFSDKTGTLTENNMQFRHCSVGGTKFVEIDNQLFKDEAGNDPGVTAGNLTEELKEFLIALALCHTVQADAEHGEESVDSNSEERDKTDSPPVTTVYKYQASSPDEKALCEAAARYGVIFKGKTGEYMELEVCGIPERYKILHILDFDSTRKRMSVILETPKSEILMLCKGAESHVTPRCVTGPTQETLDHIDGYAELGLRTLTIVSRKISRPAYDDIDKRLVTAQQAITDRETQLAKVFDDVESDFHLLGATAVEDKLQDGVKETIESLREAGIKVWVLTGDKLETAVNISHSCGHFKHGMNIMFATGKKTADEIDTALNQCQETINSSPSSEHAIVVDGATLGLILSDNSEECRASREKLVSIGENCVAVLCCRMSPLQKAQIVQLVKQSNSQPITLAIGDGANDCSMIQEAHIGCGIMGKEGRQAVRCSDYAFHRFRFLKRVLLVHGHHYYCRLAVVIQYFFYKNVAFMVPQILFQFLNGYSAMSLYSSILLTCFNILFTSLPVLFYGIFEQDLKSETLMEHPSLYRDMQKNRLLSWKQFALWMAAGAWHGLFIYYGGKTLFETSISPHMTSHGLFTVGTFIFTLVVIVTNLKLALFTHYWTWFMHVFLWGSILIYFILVFIVCAFEWPWKFLRNWFDLILDNDMYFIIYQLMDTASFWFGIIGIVWISLMPDITLTILRKHFAPTPLQRAQMMEDMNNVISTNKVADKTPHIVKESIKSTSAQSLRGQFESDDIQLIDFKRSNEHV